MMLSGGSGDEGELGTGGVTAATAVLLSDAENCSRCDGISASFSSSISSSPVVLSSVLLLSLLASASSPSVFTLTRLSFFLFPRLAAWPAVILLCPLVVTAISGPTRWLNTPIEPAGLLCCFTITLRPRATGLLAARSGTMGDELPNCCRAISPPVAAAVKARMRAEPSDTFRFCRRGDGDTLCSGAR